MSGNIPANKKLFPGNIAGPFRVRSYLLVA